MASQSSPVPSRDLLRELARLQGVEPTDDDLDAVGGFLAAILPALEAIEEALEPQTPPAGLWREEA
jgi:hypothetical protein